MNEGRNWSPTFICDALRDLVSVTIWRLHGRSNVCECMLTLFDLRVVSIHLKELAWHSNGSIKCQTLECHSKLGSVITLDKRRQ